MKYLEFLQFGWMSSLLIRNRTSVLVAAGMFHVKRPQQISAHVWRGFDYFEPHA
jgi:hypothetical protein